MRKQVSVFASLVLLFATLTGGSATANERMSDPKAAPNQAVFTIQDFTFSGLNLFDGTRYVNGSNKFKLAVPKQVKCLDYTSYTKNCIVYVRSSVETPFSSGPIGTYQPPTYFYVSVLGLPNASDNSALIMPAVMKQAAVGSEWAESMVQFSAAQSGTVFLRVRKEGTGADIPDIPIQILVRTQAEVDAERAIQAAAEKARQAEANRKERERVARILATKLSITCKSGSKTKKVVGDPPVCPKGFSNPAQNQPAFNAYSKCKLYKKQYGYSRAYLQDGGKTLQIEGYGRTSYSAIDLNDKDWACVVNAMKIPGSVQNKIGQTRALDGMVSATFSGVEAFWTFHPESGLDITFSK